MTRIKWFSSIRAFGLLLVLGYHLFYDRFPGGFLGVDVFFCLSGFLITALIVDKIRKDGRFALFSFYKRRIQRIWIPLFFAVIFTLPCLLIISPDFSVRIAEETAAALSFSMNWYQILTGFSYEARLLPQYYVHTWALAMEIQLYLVWGLVCALLWPVAKALFSQDKEKRLLCYKIFLALSAGAAVVCSYMYMQNMYDAGYSLDVLYFNPLSRSFTFFVGALAALIWGVDDTLRARRKDHRPQIFLYLLAAVCAAAIIIYNAMQYRFADEYIYRQGFISTAVLTVAIIYCMHGLHILTPKAKEPALLTATADMSYSIYLYHWPLYVACAALITENVWAALVSLALTLICAYLTYYGPKRFIPPRDESGKASPKRTLIITVGALLSASALALSGLAIYKAPAITSIETTFLTATMLQDAEAAANMEHRVKVAPVVTADDTAVAADDMAAADGNAMVDGDMTVDGDATAAAGDATTAAGDATTADGDATTAAGDATTAAGDAATADGDVAVADTLTDSVSQSIADNPADPSGQNTAEAALTVPENPPDPPGQSPADSAGTDTGTAPPAQTGNDISGGVTIIGDSVSLGAYASIQASIANCYMDSEVSRKIDAGLELLLDLEERGELRENVVIALGTNGTWHDKEKFGEIIEDLPAGHRLIFVTPFDGRTNTNASILNDTAQWMRGLPDEYDFISIADWNAAVSGQVGILAKDKVHLRSKESMTLYANCLAQALEDAAGKPAKQ